DCLPWSRSMNKMLLAVIPPYTDTSRYLCSLGAATLMFGIFFSRYARQFLTLPQFNFLGYQLIFRDTLSVKPQMSRIPRQHHSPSPLPDTAASARYYRRLILSFYALWVLPISNPFVWRCPTKTVLVPFFRANVGRRHMDVGVGTGYFPAIAMTASD